MSRVTRVLLLLAVVVPVTAYVAGSVAPTGPAVPTDHSPVILRDRVDDRLGTTTPVAPPTSGAPATPRRTRVPTPTGDGDRPPGTRDDGDEARVVTPQPTPVGEDDDDEWDDDGPDEDDDETDDRDDSGDDGDDGDD